jgi:hypothetical protein
MIVCKLELWPGGLEEDVEALGRIEIANDLLSSVRSEGKRGTYFWKMWKKRPKWWAKGKVEEFPRLSYHPWNLVLQILNDAAKRNGGRI